MVRRGRSCPPPSIDAESIRCRHRTREDLIILPTEANSSLAFGFGSFFIFFFFGVIIIVVFVVSSFVSPFSLSSFPSVPIDIW